MDRKDFFKIPSSKVNSQELLKFQEEDSVEVLNEKFKWVSKINDEESGRYTSLRQRADVLLTFHISFASLLLSGTYFGLFSAYINDKTSVLIISAGMFFVLCSIICGAYYSFKVVGVPSFKHFVDPTLALEPYSSQKEWLQKAITEVLIIYKKNLDIIEDIAFKTRLSSDFLVLGMVATLTMLGLAPISPMIKSIFFVSPSILGGVVIGIAFVFASIYFLICKPRPYR